MLRKLAATRKVMNSGSYKKLPLEVEIGVCKILKEEIRLSQSLKPLKLALAERSGYKIYQLFELVTGSSTRFITPINLKQYLKNYGIYALDTDLHAIIQRLDKDQDGKASYMDFLDSILPLWPRMRYSSIEIKEVPGRYRFSSPQPRTYPRVEDLPLSRSEIRSEAPIKLENQRIRQPEDEFRPLQMSDEKNLSMDTGVQTLRNETQNQEIQANQQEEIKEKLPRGADEAVDLEQEKPQENEPEKQSEIQKNQPQEPISTPPPKKLMPREIEENEVENKYQTPEKQPLASPEYPTTGDTPERVYEMSEISKEDPKLIKSRQDSLARLFKTQLSTDKNAEDFKERVCIKLDYNPRDAFNFFDIYGKGSISLYELRKGIEALGINAISKNLILVMKRYDVDQNGCLSYDEFEEMVLPQKEYYRNLAASRIPRSKPGEFVFKFDTKLLFKELMQAIIDTEYLAEKLRQTVVQGFSKDPNSYVIDAFSASSENKDHLTTQDVF